VAGGLPDLVLWQPEQRRLRLVEVKGPRDRLSEQQSAWLSALGAAGVEVRGLWLGVVSCRVQPSCDIWHVEGGWSM
jgi:hypothetical protein